MNMWLKYIFFNSTVCAWLVESFPYRMRLTSVAVGYNLAQGMFLAIHRLFS